MGDTVFVMNHSHRLGNSSTWAPLRFSVFRWLWVASMVSNVGTYMQTVGAQWFLINAAHAAVLVSLVQTADMLPDVMFGIVGGVLADTLDRRRLLVVVQTGLVVATSALAGITLAGLLSPALLLILTFVIGTGSVLGIPAAAELSSINVNLARAIGPAIAGILIAYVGVGGVFVIDAATFLFYGLVVALWRQGSDIPPRASERFVSALRAGGRYVRYAPVVRRILLRSALFLVPGSALWALLPLVASSRLGLGASGYGLLLGALGVGAVAGASVLSKVRSALSPNALIALMGGIFAAALVGVILIRSTVVVAIVLLPAGMAWVGMLATVNTLLQLFLPTWVRARGLSVYQMVLFGGQGLGALAWGLIADSFGLTLAFVLAAGMMAATAASVRFWPLVDTSGMDRRSVVRPDPSLETETETGSGSVVVRTTYSVSPENEMEFLRAMAKVRGSRLRTGATQWGIFRDGEARSEFEEIFVVPSWEEHLRQHRERMTATDLSYIEQAIALSDLPPHTRHLLSADIDQ